MTTDDPQSASAGAAQTSVPLIPAAGLHDGTSADRERPVFTAVITPHRSLGRHGFRLLIALLCIASVVSSLPFVIMGAWPVAGFFGLDLLALYIAFRVSFARASAFEEIILSPLELLLRKVSHRGQRKEWRFNPLWTRLERDVHAEFGVQQLALVSRGQRITVAHELAPEEKAKFGDALGRALADIKRG
ncbi:MULTISPECIES: DUF2244 domain-containing protein [unclassified Chelatococcus]|uniref:DUF2244 domain-containing protein n=1 Tax=unclassified Chelatococcus TaxID=2638111 RepID=UPI001BCDE09D|nr:MULTISPECIES: DUF2244 domain-containing protein [unclassified Chelatococcus]MBS7696379.1 DUF2244 domain-containing protein [Chelatococcus sp. YT9]MBX3556989.1 DUF2244 domain-containing protein [Chelatococcus sp.]